MPQIQRHWNHSSYLSFRCAQVLAQIVGFGSDIATWCRTSQTTSLLFTLSLKMQNQQKCVFTRFGSLIKHSQCEVCTACGKSFWWCAAPRLPNNHTGAYTCHGTAPATPGVPVPSFTRSQSQTESSTPNRATVHVLYTTWAATHQESFLMFNSSWRYNINTNIVIHSCLCVKLKLS